MKWLGYALLFVVAIWWTVAQWTECRDMGFSVFYCLQHIS